MEVVADADRESMKPRKKRSPTNKAGLVHTKRMALALFFIVSFCQSTSTVTRVHLIDQPPRDLALLLDASPAGVGGALLHLATRKVTGAFSYETEERVAVEMSLSLG